MKAKCFYLVALLSLLFAPNAQGATHYIRAAASGLNSGANWTDAWSTFAAVTWTRGDLYYISSGSYGGPTLSTSESSTSTIEIRAAVGGAGDHGTSTGWSDAFQGQATFTSMTWTTGYWIFNGQAVPGCTYPSNSTACYLLKVNNTGIHGQAFQLGSGSAVNYATIEYTEVQGSNVHTDGADDEGINCTPGPCGNVYVGHSWIHNVGGDNLSFNENTDSIGNLFEYNWISYNDNGPTTGLHAQGIQSTLTDMIMRYNVFQDMQSSGAITDAAGGNAPIGTWAIYGNIFFWDATWIATYRGNPLVGYDDGIVGIFSLAPNAGTLLIYNNTITSPGLAGSQNCNAQAYTINAGMVLSSATIKNNIWFNYNSSECNAGVAGTGSYDYNGYYKVSGGLPGGEGANSYSLPSTDPFVGSTLYTIAGYQLSANTNAGLTLSTPYDQDMLGVTRGANGTWDIGALQISGAPPSPNYDSESPSIIVF